MHLKLLSTRLNMKEQGIDKARQYKATHSEQYCVCRLASTIVSGEDNDEASLLNALNFTTYFNLGRLCSRSAGISNGVIASKTDLSRWSLAEKWLARSLGVIFLLEYQL